MTSVLSSGGDMENRPLTLREKKQLQWAQEKNESSVWYPFGSPGGGDPIRPPRKSRSLSGANLTSPKVATGSNGPSSSGSPSSGANAPLPPLQPQYIMPMQQPYAYAPFHPDPSQNGYDTLLAANNMLPGGYAMYSQPGSPYLQPLPMQNGVAFPGHANMLANHPADPISPSPGMRGNTLQPLSIPGTSTPMANGVSPGGSYTEQWANQLEHWQRPPDNVTQVPSVPKSRHASTNGQSPSVISNYTMPMSLPPSALHNGAMHPAAAWMIQQGQRPVLVSALNPGTPVDPATLSLTPIGVNDGAHYSNGFDDSPMRAQMALGPQDSVSAVTGPSTSRRRSSRSRLGSEDLNEERLRAIEIRESIDSQVEDKMRRQVEEDEREKREQIQIERDRRRIEQREEEQADEERNKWKKHWDNERSREQKALDALKKAEEDARLVRHAKLRRHADRGKENLDESYDIGQNGSISYEYADESSNLSKSMTALERAREEAEQIVRREEADRQYMDRIIQNKREAAALKPKPNFERSQSQPPPQVKSPMDSRPIKPQTEDPLQIWENYAQKLAQQRESETRLSRRAAPTRQSMRVKSNPKMVKEPEKIKRSDSLERLNKAKNDSVAQPEVNNNNLLKPTPNLVRPSTVVIARNTNGPPRPEAIPVEIPNTNLKKKARSMKTSGSSADLLMAALGYDSTDSPDSSVSNNAAKPPKSQRSREKKRTIRADKSPSMKLTNTKSPTRVSPQRNNISGSNPAAKSDKLLKKRPSLERMLQPTQSGSDSETLADSTTASDFNPLYEPIKTRRKKKPISASNSKDMLNLSNGDLSSLSINNQSSDSASLRSQDDEQMKSTPKSRLRSSSLLNLNSAANKETKDKSSKLRIERDDDVITNSTAFLRPSANLNTFNAKSPLYSSIRMKRNKPNNERQKKVLEQLSNLRKQLKDKQLQVESAFTTNSKETGESRI